MSLELKDLFYQYEGDGKPFSLRVDLSVPSKTKLAILGPNGSGKSTFLKLLGGHLRPKSGAIFIDGEDITNQSPRKRSTSTVFQDYALFPHLTVAENINFAIRHKRGLALEVAAGETASWLKRLDLEEVVNEKPGKLSCGYQQRVAIARSLSVQPKVLLLDEPSAALDVHQRQELILLLNKVAVDWAQILIVVTHDLDLAFSVADTVAVMMEGRILAVDSPLGLYNSPGTLRLAQYIHSHNVIYGDVQGDGCFKWGQYRLALPTNGKAVSNVGRAHLLIKPTDISIIDVPDANSFSGSVVARNFRGPYCELVILIADTTVRCLTSETRLLPEVGRNVALHLETSRSILIWEHGGEKVNV